MNRRARRSPVRSGCECGHSFGARTTDSLTLVHRHAHLVVRGSVWLLCPECQLPRTFKTKASR